MRKFKFIGDPDEYTVIQKGEVVPEGFHPNEWDEPVEVFYDLFPDDWEEVEEDPTWIFEPSNQDKPASEMTKFEMAVFGNVRTIVTMAEPIKELNCKVIVFDAIELAKETFKQLDELK